MASAEDVKAFKDSGSVKTHFTTNGFISDVEGDDGEGVTVDRELSSMVQFVPTLLPDTALFPTSHGVQVADDAAP